MGAELAHPRIIQGGMGVAVSNWRLARAVSLRGGLGVVSGTGIEMVLTRRLQDGDPGGHMRRAIERFPIREVAERVWERYFVPGGKAPDAPYKSKPMPALKSPRALDELYVLANFVEVFLAKEGHRGVVGLNLLEKIQLPTLPSLFGAMLAGVDYVLMGAGIPRNIPGALDRLARLEKAELPLDVSGTAAGETFASEFEPSGFPIAEGELKRPFFLPIISSSTLAITLARKATGRVDGFVVEGPLAGGHNAPPRGAMKLDENGEPIYGDRDVPDLAQIAGVGLPFWMAGTYGSEGKLREAMELGAQGVQVGTAFAFCDESGIDPEIKRRVLERVAAGEVHVHTDPSASPTGFPFKVAGMDATLSDMSVYERRERICDIGYLRELYRKEDGSVGYRCAAEPVEDFVAKGGTVEGAVGRKCLCNGLMSTVGVGQVRQDGTHEPPIVTAGNDLVALGRYLGEGRTSYTADEVIDQLLARVPATA